MSCKDKKKKKCEIGLQHMRPSQVSEKQSMTLQESNYRIYEVGEQDRECEYQEDSPSHIHGREYNTKQECRQEDVDGTAIWERHMYFPSTREGSN